MVSRLVGLVLAAFWTTAGLCHASESDMPDPQDLIKWVQFPDLDHGCDYWSHYRDGDIYPQYGRADDWECLDGLPVTDVHWWGFYQCNQYGPIDGFAISIYENVPAGTGGCFWHAHPGDLLSQEVVAFAETGETLVGTDALGKKVYEYSVYLDDPFEQEQGEIYWLSIVALSGGTCGPTWGWHCSDTHNLDSAVVGRLTVPAASTVPVFGPTTYPFCQDLAFALTTIPEPGLCLLAILGLVGALWRKTFRL